MVPQFMVQVKLPNSGGYSGSPSGDTQYEIDYNKALADATPPGFKVVPAKLGHRDPVDTEGYTWVRLACEDTAKPLVYWMARAEAAEAQLAKIKKTLGELLK